MLKHITVLPTPTTEPKVGAESHIPAPQRLFFRGDVQRKSTGKPQGLTCRGFWEREKNRCEVWVGKGLQTTREFRWPGAGTVAQED